MHCLLLALHRAGKWSEINYHKLNSNAKN